MVRDCTEDDLDWLMQMAVKFNNEYYDVPLHLTKLCGYLRRCISDGVALRTDNGGIVGFVTEDPLRDWTVLVETGWYSEGRDGLRLLREFEKRGRLLLCDEIRMTTLETNPEIKRVLSRMGYSPIEVSHRKLM